MARKTKTISDQIRDAMKASPLTRYRISKMTGIDQTALMRFERGEVGLLLDNIDKLAAALGLTVVRSHGEAVPPARSTRRK